MAAARVRSTLLICMLSVARAARGVRECERLRGDHDPRAPAQPQSATPTKKVGRSYVLGHVAGHVVALGAFANTEVYAMVPHSGKVWPTSMEKRCEKAAYAR